MKKETKKILKGIKSMFDLTAQPKKEELSSEEVLKGIKSLFDLTCKKA